MVKFTPRSLYPGKNPGINRIACWEGPRAGVHFFGEKKNLLPVLGFELRNADSQYRICYPGSESDQANMKSVGPVACMK